MKTINKEKFLRYFINKFSVIVESARNYNEVYNTFDCVIYAAKAMLGNPTDCYEFFMIRGLKDKLEDIAYSICKNEGFEFPDSDCEPYFYDNAFCYQ